MAKPLSENARTILTYLQDNSHADVNYGQIAEATGLAPRTVNGIVTSALVKRELAVRIQVEGSDKKIIRLTDLGMNYDPTADDTKAE